MKRRQNSAAGGAAKRKRAGLRSILLTMTSEQRDEIGRAAAEDGRSVAGFLRWAALCAARQALQQPARKEARNGQ